MFNASALLSNLLVTEALFCAYFTEKLKQHIIIYAMDSSYSFCEVNVKNANAVPQAIFHML